MGVVLLFVAYIKIDGNTVPVVCEDIQISPVLNGYIVLKSVKEARDGTVPSLKVEEICIKLEQLSHYVKGRLV